MALVDDRAGLPDAGTVRGASTDNLLPFRRQRHETLVQ